MWMDERTKDEECGVLQTSGVDHLENISNWGDGEEKAMHA